MTEADGRLKMAEQVYVSSLVAVLLWTLLDSGDRPHTLPYLVSLPDAHEVTVCLPVPVVDGHCYGQMEK